MWRKPVILILGVLLLAVFAGVVAILRSNGKYSRLLAAVPSAWTNIRVGMSTNQVEELLGSPVMTGWGTAAGRNALGKTFTMEEWRYTFGDIESNAVWDAHYVIWFANGIVASVEIK